MPNSTLEDLKKIIFSKISIEDFYKEHAKMSSQSSGGDEILGYCPFHEDDTASISFNMKKGLWHCFGACQEGGSIFDFYMKLNNCSFRDSLAFFAKKADINLADYNYTPKDLHIIDDKIADTYHQNLLGNNTALQAFTKKRGINVDYVKKFKIGYERESGRYTLPIYDQYEHLLNIRKYDMNAKDKGYKMLNYTQPKIEDGKQVVDGNGKKVYEHLWGTIRIFNIHRLLTKKKILLCEGETDAIIAEQQGVDAVSVTGGAGSFKSDWAKLFKDKIVYIAYDLDTAGAKGAVRIAEQLKGYAEKVYIVKLPDELGQGGDVTDYFVKFSYNLDKFAELLRSSKSITAIEAEQDKPLEIKLAETTKAKYKGKRIKTQVLISGKNDPAYMVPSRVVFYCNSGGGKKCKNCKLLDSGEFEYLVDPKKPEVLEFVNVTKAQQEAAIRKIVGNKCPECEIDFPEGENINVEEVRAIPKIDTGSSNADYVEKTLYYVGEGIKTNQTYTIEGYVFPEPRKQLATVIIDNIKSADDNIESFKLTQEVKNELEIFRVKPGQKISEKFTEIYNDIERNVTHIWGRKDMMMAFDWTFFSPQYIMAQGDLIKGWVVSFILGDTATGKSELIKKMLAHYGVGERVGGQGLTVPGLIGAVTQQDSGRWFVRWGLLPLNDKRAVVIEEVTDMSGDIMEKLTDIMSSGVIQINKANGHERTNARTRLMFVSNTKRGAKLESYSDGPSAFREIVYKDEDIRRMDFILTVSKDEVSPDMINKPLSEFPEVPHIYTAAANCKLILWAWSRTSDQIIFTPEAEAEIFAASKRMLHKYHDKFPIIEQGDTKNKLRRLSVATAMRVFNSDETGEKVIIEQRHVQFVEHYLNVFFSKASMAYDLFSENAKRKYTLNPERKVKLIEYFKMLPEWRDLLKVLWESAVFRKGDVVDRVGYEKDEIRVVFKFLSNNYLIRSIGNHGYRKENNLVAIIRELMRNEMISNDADEVYMPEQISKGKSKNIDEQELM